MPQLNEKIYRSNVRSICKHFQEDVVCCHTAQWQMALQSSSSLTIHRDRPQGIGVKGWKKEWENVMLHHK